MRIPRLLRPLIALVPPLLAGCAATADETRPLAAAETAMALNRADADPALWKLSDEDTTVYLFGTMHIVKPDLVWFDDAVANAFAASDELVLEMVEPPMAEAQQVMMAKAMIGDGTTLSAMLNAQQRAQLASAAEGAGIPMAVLDRMQPWFAASMIALTYAQKLGYTPEVGAEKVLTGAAKENNKAISGLEGFEQQIGFLAGLSPKAQIDFLMATAEDPAEIASDMARLERAWALGDIVDTAALMNEGMKDNPELAQTLLFNRNRNWAQWIDRRMEKPGTVFIAVGAGHLAGEQSVQAMLAQRGRTVAQIDY